MAVDDPPRPSLLGLAPSFGFGDRLGLATPGHLEACRRGPFRPLFAQQSIREMQRTQRTPGEVMASARTALAAAGYAEPWGADADHLKTRDDVERLAAAGFTFFTIDPSEQVDNRADSLAGDALREAAEAVVAAGAFESLGELEALHLGRQLDLPECGLVGFEARQGLYRAAVKYGRAVAHAATMAGWIAAAAGAGRHEIEVSVDETDTPTSWAEHAFIAAELRRRGVAPVSLAPRFVGEFQKGIDYRGDLAAFERSLRGHEAIARALGPYKISVHSGSDKFAIYPILGRVCGELLHVKTAGTSYLEALRCVCRVDPPLFAQIAAFARERFPVDRASYHVSARLEAVDPPAGLDAGELERHYLGTDDGRQILHVTFGSVLTRAPLKEAILERLAAHAELHRELLAAHLGRHIGLLQAG